MLRAFAGRMVRNAMRAAFRDLSPLSDFELDVSFKPGQGPKEFDRRIKAIIRELQADFKPHDEAGSYMVEQINRTIDARRTIEGASWPRLAPSTIARKGHDKPLIKTGRLQRSIKHQVLQVGRKDTATRISPEGLLGRRGSIKARVHQGRGLGTVIMTGKGRKTAIPSRPYMGIGPTQSREVESIFRNHVERGLATRR